MILCENLTRAFGEEGIFGLDFEVKQGEALCLLGPSSAGKSLTVSLLMGFARADSGKASIFDMDCYTKRTQIQKRLAYAPAHPQLPPRQTGEEYLRFIARYHGGFNPEKARRFTERLDVDLTSQGRLLGPEGSKKLALLSAFCLDSEVMILDEPMVGLSPMARDATADAIRQETSAGRAVLMTSHILEEARRSCTQVAIIRKGRLIISQPVEALAAIRQKVYHITFETAAQAASFAGEWEAGVELIGSRAMVAIPGSPQVLLQTLQKYTIVDLVGGREEAEENFLRYYGDDLL